MRAKWIQFWENNASETDLDRRGVWVGAVVTPSQKKTQTCLRFGEVVSPSPHKNTNKNKNSENIKKNDKKEKRARIARRSGGRRSGARRVGAGSVGARRVGARRVGAFDAHIDSHSV